MTVPFAEELGSYEEYLASQECYEELVEAQAAERLLGRIVQTYKDSPLLRDWVRGKITF